MMVVIGIMAILTLLGASSLLSARDQYIANQVAEEAVSAIREAQNRSISFMQSGLSDSTKLWGASFEENEIYIISVDDNGENHIEKTVDFNPNVNIIPAVGSGSHIYFASPFGTPYLTEGACESWEESLLKPSKEYIPTGCTIISGDAEATISVDYKGHIFNVKINSEGNPRIE